MKLTCPFCYYKSNYKKPNVLTKCAKCGTRFIHDYFNVISRIKVIEKALEICCTEPGYHDMEFDDDDNMVADNSQPAFF